MNEGKLYESGKLELTGPVLISEMIRKLRRLQKDGARRFGGHPESVYLAYDIGEKDHRDVTLSVLVEDHRVK